MIDDHERDQVAHGVVSAAEAAKSLRREFAGLSGREPDTITRREIVGLFDRIRDGVRAMPFPGPDWSRRCGRAFMAFWRGPRTPDGFERTSWRAIAPRGGARLRSSPPRRAPPTR